MKSVHRGTVTSGISSGVALGIAALATALSVAAVAGEPATPSRVQEAMYQALVSHEAGVDCGALDAMSADPVGDLTFIVDHAEKPAWVAMRAAHCLIQRHAVVAEPVISGWMTGGETRGLALLTAKDLDSVPADLAERLARQALNGPHAAAVRPRLADSAHPKLRAMAR